MTALTPTSRMRAEIEEIPQAADRLRSPAAQEVFAETAAVLKAQDPAFVMTVARGSSDHAATYLSYCIQIATGLPVASLGPSVASVYGADLTADRAVAFAISQSGGSQDLLRSVAMLSRGGALPVVITNTGGSPLALVGRPSIDILAGPEVAVAATKSYVNSILAGLWVLVHWVDDTALKRDLERVGEVFSAALQTPIDPLVDALAEADSLTTTGRGPTYGLALEAALKVQELLGADAAAYSGAELLHGPISRMTHGHNVLSFAQPGAPGMAQAEASLRGQGATLLHVTAQDGDTLEHPFLSNIASIVTFYAAIEKCARLLGRDPDKPAFLKKETVTT